MMKFILYLYLISCILSKFNSFGKRDRQKSSPCPDIYRETSPGYGKLTVPSPEINERLVLVVEFVVFGLLVSEDVGSLSLSRSVEETGQMIRNGAATTNYVLRFPDNPNLEVPPQITRIYYNDDIICSSVAESSTSGSRTNIKLQRSLTIRGRPSVKPTSAYNNPKRPVFKPKQQPPDTQPPALALTLPSNVRDKDVCGRVDPRFRIIPLVIGGDDIIHGTWPWLVAIFLARGKSFSYRCGGNLVSNRVVVSAAHCFFNGRSIISATEIYAHMGRHNLGLGEEEEGEQRRQASLIKVHDDFKRGSSSSYDADIAVIVLKRVVEYTLYIRPICLWAGNNQLSKIVKKKGKLVGWGLSDSESNEPKTIDIPIVSQQSCLKNPVLPFARITSNRTFCAGSRNGAGPCNGDSGSGLALQQNRKWALRGIVSVAVTIDQWNNKCNLQQYVVFTDAARFITFIREYINLPI